MIRYDCRHYVGRKPCRHKRTCDGCPHFDPVKSRILIIKLGALGDLLRTTAILSGLKAAYPGSQITWLTQKSCVPLLANLPEIDKVWVTDEFATSRVSAEEFDLMINFDKDTPAVELATLSRAREKKGFGLSPRGELITLNPGSEYALRLGIDDDLKFRVNQKSYQRIIYEMADLPWPKSPPPYRLDLTEKEKAFGSTWLNEQLHQKEKHRILAMNPGCGKIFATKKWHPDRYTEVARRLNAEHGVVPMLLGGADEQELLDSIHKGLNSSSVPVLRPGESLSLREFASVVSQADAMLCGDTLAMHVALAQHVPTTVIFTSTCSQEIELYGIGNSVIGKAPCAPCYLSQCSQKSQHCADSISVDSVVSAVASLIGTSRDEKVRHSTHV